MQVVGAPLARCSDTAAVPSCRARPSASFLGNARALSTHRATPARRQGGGGSSLVVAGLFGLGLPELVVIGGVAALAFGPAKLPELGKSLGKTVKSFQTAAKEFETELKTAQKGDPDASGDAQRDDKGQPPSA